MNPPSLPSTANYNQIKVMAGTGDGRGPFVYGKPADSTVNFANSTDEGAQVIVRWDPKNPPKPGDTITVTAAAASVHLFNATTGERLK